MFLPARKIFSILADNFHGIIRQEVWFFEENKLIKGHQKLLTNKFVEARILTFPENMIRNIHKSLVLCPNAPNLRERVSAQDAINQVR